MPDTDFQKDLSHLTWDEVLRRQVERAALVPAWLDALPLRAGMHVLDVGSGPGFVSRQIAERVGPRGAVLAVDRAPDAIGYLERMRDEEGLAQIRPMVADAATADLRGQRIDAALVTMMLHHVEDAAALLRNVAGWLAPGVRLVVAEFDPEGPCTSGPPREHRIQPEQAHHWCEQAGLKVVGERQLSPEHYMVLLERGDEPLSADRPRDG